MRPTSSFRFRACLFFSYFSLIRALILNSGLISLFFSIPLNSIRHTFLHFEPNKIISWIISIFIQLFFTFSRKTIMRAHHLLYRANILFSLFFRISAECHLALRVKWQLLSTFMFEMSSARWFTFFLLNNSVFLSTLCSPNPVFRRWIVTFS